MVASDAHIRRIPRLALKHYWSSALDDLKQDCILAHSVWDSAGHPRSGNIFELKKNAKYIYKLAIRDAANQFETRFDDELANSYLDKYFNTFWRLCKNKVHAKSLIFLMLLVTLMMLALLVLLQHIFLIPILQPPIRQLRCVMCFRLLTLRMVIKINCFLTHRR